MFGLAGLAAPLIGNMLGGIFGGQGNQGSQGSQGCHGHHHHHNNNNNNNFNQAAQDFRMARQDFGDAQRNFAQGNVFGGLSELAEARQHMADGYSHLNGRGGGGGWI